MYITYNIPPQNDNFKFFRLTYSLMKAIKEAVVRLFGREDPLTNQDVNILNNKEIENKEGYPLSVETTKASLFFDIS